MKKSTVTRSEKLCCQIVQQILPEFSTALIQAIQEGKFMDDGLGLRIVRNSMALSPILDKLLYPFHLDGVEHSRVEWILREEAYRLIA